MNAKNRNRKLVEFEINHFAQLYRMFSVPYTLS